MNKILSEIPISERPYRSCVGLMVFNKDGNVFCGRRYKLVSDEKKPWSWEYRECHALLKKAEQGVEPDELPF